MTEQERLALYTSVVPNHRQLRVQEMGFYAFVHYSMNTFTGREWGDGKESPALFAPTAQDTDQWCRAIKAAGMKGLVLTCKHHDGFCLWPTKTTEHCVRNSPYKNGKGDVVREAAESCRKYGLKFGVYLSPWDRNCPLYGTEAYNDFYIEQLTELLTGYGEIFTLWMDGACGADADGKPCQRYDFERIWSTALRLQPNIALSNCGPDVRWVGNESGVARKSEWNVVPRFQIDRQNLAGGSQTEDDREAFQKRCIDVMREDLGSRQFLADYDEFMWYPAEVDVSIRPGWYYHPEESEKIRALDDLMRIYYGSVGSNSLLILNIPPNREGRFEPGDVERLEEMGRWLRKEEDCVIKSSLSPAPDGMSFEIIFEKQTVDRIRFAEDCAFSQRIERYSVWAEGEKVHSGTVVGFNRIAVFDRPVTTGRLRLVIEECRGEPHIERLQVCLAGSWRPGFEKGGAEENLRNM